MLRFVGWANLQYRSGPFHRIEISSSDHEADAWLKLLKMQAEQLIEFHCSLLSISCRSFLKKELFRGQKPSCSYFEAISQVN